MQIRWEGWLLSINLNKGPYSTCMNPHILLINENVKWKKYYYPHRQPKWCWGWTFKEHPRFNIELNWKQRRFKNKWPWKSKNSWEIRVISVFKIWPFSLYREAVVKNSKQKMFVEKKDVIGHEYRLYLSLYIKNKPLFGIHTKQWKWFISN